MHLTIVFVSVGVHQEIDKRKRYEEAYKHALADKPKHVVLGGPDYEEGPHCVIKEDEFFDAVDSALDKIEKEQQQVRGHVGRCPTHVT